jgi:hypothetical protein
VKFACQNCGKTYATDEKVTRAFKMRCRRCGNLMVFGVRSAPAAPGAGRKASSGTAQRPEPASGPRVSEPDIWAELTRELAAEQRPGAVGRNGSAGQAVAAGAMDLEVVTDVILDLVPLEEELAGPLGPAPQVHSTPVARRSGPRPKVPRRRLPLAASLGAVLLAAGASTAAAWKLVGPGRGPAAAPKAKPHVVVVELSSPAAPGPSGPALSRPGAPTLGARPAALAGLAPAPVSEAIGAGAAARRDRGLKPIPPARRREARVVPPRLEPAPPAPEVSSQAPGSRIAMIPGVPRPAPGPADAPPRPFDDAGVEAALTRGARAFEACLAAARRVDPKVALEWDWLPVPLTMVVSPAGKAVFTALEDPELNRSELGRCLRRECEAIPYPPFAGEPVRVHKLIRLHDSSANTHNTRRRGL